MKTKKDKENETLSVICGVVVAILIVWVVVAGSVITIALDKLGL